MTESVTVTLFVPVCLVAADSLIVPPSNHRLVHCLEFLFSFLLDHICSLCSSLSSSFRSAERSR